MLFTMGVSVVLAIWLLTPDSSKKAEEDRYEIEREAFTALREARSNLQSNGWKVDKTVEALLEADVRGRIQRVREANARRDGRATKDSWLPSLDAFTEINLRDGVSARDIEIVNEINGDPLVWPPLNYDAYPRAEELTTVEACAKAQSPNESINRYRGSDSIFDRERKNLLFERAILLTERLAILRKVVEFSEEAESLKAERAKRGK